MKHVLVTSSGFIGRQALPFQLEHHVIARSVTMVETRAASSTVCAFYAPTFPKKLRRFRSDTRIGTTEKLRRLLNTAKYIRPETNLARSWSRGCR